MDSHTLLPALAKLRDIPMLSYTPGLWAQRRRLEESVYRDHRTTSKLEPRYSWITIALPSTFCPRKALELMLSLKTRYSSFKRRKLWFNIEFYSQSGYNLHCHLLVTSNPVTLHKHNTIKNLSQCFGIAQNFIDIQTAVSQHHIFEKINYLKGLKASSKLEHVAADKNKRLQLLIEDYYVY